MVSRDVTNRISRDLDISDWWVIYMLGRNLEPHIFRDVLHEFANEIQPKREDKD